MAERTILLMRHADTQLSTGKRLIGQSDVELSEQGIARCHCIGEAIGQYSIDHVFSSGLKRAIQTAQILNSYIGKEIHSVEAFDEIALGEWDGHFIEDIKREYPDEYALCGRDLIHYRPPGGENFIDLQARVMPAFREILTYEGNLLIVSHMSVHRVILADILAVPLANVINIPQGYGACHILVRNGDEI